MLLLGSLLSSRCLSLQGDDHTFLFGSLRTTSLSSGHLQKDKEGLSADDYVQRLLSKSQVYKVLVEAH
jgi:hypothetical protein